MLFDLSGLLTGLPDTAFFRARLGLIDFPLSCLIMLLMPQWFSISTLFSFGYYIETQ